MKRLNLRDVPDDVYETLADAAEASGRSLNAFVVEGCGRSPTSSVSLGTSIPICLPATPASRSDAVAAVRAVRDAS